MTKTRLFLLFLLTAAFAACNKTDTPPGGNPIAVTLSQTTATANAGDSVSITCTITDQNALKDVVITESLGGGSPTQLASYSLSGKSYQFTQVYHVPSGFTGDIVLTFTVDDASNTQTAKCTITVGSTSADFNSYSAVLLASYNDNAAGSFYASTNNNVYTVSSAKSNQGLIDMAFFYGSTNKYTLAAPSSTVFGDGTNGTISSLQIQTWTTRNATSFKTTTLSDFSSIKSGADIATAYAAGTAFSTSALANQLSAGQIIAFSTQAGKMGLCKIIDVANGNTSGLGEMHIQVVVQK